MTRKEATQHTPPRTHRVTISHFGDAFDPQGSLPAADTRTGAIAMFESIHSYYHTIGGAGREHHCVSLSRCFAARLALLIISVISEGRFRTNEEGALPGEFYRLCLGQATRAGLADEIADDEILLIGIKQCLMMLTAAGIVKRACGLAEIDRDGLTESTIHPRLFNAFWNLTPWEEIFPSDPEAARELRLDKHILKDLLARHDGAVGLETVANEFFELTGFSAPRDMKMISFLDFYFFAWLERFGVIRYLDGGPFDPVRISVTDVGKNLLRSYS